MLYFLSSQQNLLGYFVSCYFFYSKRPEAAGGMAETAVERLKITQVLQRGWATMFEQAQYEQAVQYAECHAWYDYLSSGRDFAQTVAMFREWSQALSLRDASREMELLHEGKARLIRHHLAQRNRSHQPGNPCRSRRSLGMYSN